MSRGATTSIGADDILFGSLGPRSAPEQEQELIDKQLKQRLISSFHSLRPREQRILKAALLLSVKNKDGRMTVKQIAGKLSVSTNQPIFDHDEINKKLGYLVDAGWMQSDGVDHWSLTEAGAVVRDSEEGVDLLAYR